MINIGVIGAGYWGKKVINEYHLLSKINDDLKLFGICDTSKPILKEYEEKKHIPLITSDYRDLLNTPEIQAVHICTPNETHYTICKKALEYGKHVLLEKPMTLDPSQAYELIDIAKEKGTLLLVGHIFRFNNALSILQKKIIEGYLGKIFHLRLQWTTFMDPPHNRDIISDLAPHPIDILNYLLDQWPIEIQCFTNSRLPGQPELAYINAKFHNKITAHIELSWQLPGKIRRATIYGSERIADCDCLKQNIIIYEKDKSYNLEIDVNNTLLTELKYFIDSIKNNDISHDFKLDNSGIIGAKTVEILELCNKSMKNNMFTSSNEERYKSNFSILKDIIVGKNTRILDQVNLYKCTIGKNCKIDAFVYIEEGVTIGDNCKIRAFSFIPTGVIIEDDVFIGPNVVFTNDKYPRASGDWTLLKTLVKRGASIGANSTILPGITIGESAIIGAGSVVTKDIPDNSIFIGNPAKKMRVYK